MDTIMYVLVALLAVGLICNLMIRPLASKWFMTPGELAKERQHDAVIVALDSGPPSSTRPTPWILVALAWLGVGIPIAWGLYRTMRSVVAFLH